MKYFLSRCTTSLDHYIYAEKQTLSIPIIEDIGHVMATALKAQYKDSKGYKSFTE